MLELKHITKTYRVGEVETRALDDVSVAFRQKEFVAILGPSGSGKTTCLNIIGGLDQYDSGELTIKGKSTKKFKERDWDAYRNNSVGFVFQSYNLIPHLSIVANVEMGMTLSGVSGAEKHKRALEVLEQVGLKDHLHKKPNQLSGGQMQRVAIARALANDPEILLCDEPTGALDTATSRQIMDLIQSLAKDRLVIMVTHNPDLAQEYAQRIIRFQDGKIVSDTHPHQERPKPDGFSLKKTSMSFFTALKLSMGNILTKKGRTTLTAFASSIGIIGIALVLSLSNGFQQQINLFQSETLSEFPVLITQSAMETSRESDNEAHQAFLDEMEQTGEYTGENVIYLYDSEANSVMHVNNLSQEYLDYIADIDSDICQSIGYTYLAQMNLLRDTGNGIEQVSLSGGLTDMATSSMASMTSVSAMGLSSYPLSTSGDGTAYLTDNYDLLSGSFPSEVTDLVLVVDEDNKVDVSILENLGFDVQADTSIQFEDIIGAQLKLIHNDDFYQSTAYGGYIPGTDFQAMYDSENSLTLTITGVVREKPDNDVGLLSPGIAYSDGLSQLVIQRGEESDIIKAQQDSDYNVLTMEPLADEDAKDQVLTALGGSGAPYVLMLYPTDFESKDAILDYLDAYNADKASEDQVLYTDLAGTVTDLTGSIMDGITLVLVAFASISLVVSLIMVAIITYISVLERTKEIGILRALGARKKDITRVFNAETFITGVFSGLLGIVIAYLLTIPINSLIYSLTGLENCAVLNPLHAILLVVISTVLTMLGGFIPAKMAARRDAVDALRSE